MTLEYITKLVGRIVWILAGLLIISILSLAIHGIIVVHNDITEVTSQLTIEDFRQGLNLIQQQLDNDTLALEIERSLAKDPIEFTPQTWQSFLDFCDKTGYVVSDYNWQRFRYGELKP